MPPARITSPSTAGALPEALNRWCEQQYRWATLAHAAATKTGPAIAWDGSKAEWLDFVDTGARELVTLCMSLNIWRPK